MLLIGLIILAIVVKLFTFNKLCVKYRFNMQKLFQETINIMSKNTHLPLKVNSAGVIPVIFASAFLMTPRTIAQLFPDSSVSKWLVANLDFAHPIGMTLYVGLIVAFTYFYAFIQVNPEQMAENLKSKMDMYLVFVLVNQQNNM